MGLYSVGMNNNIDITTLVRYCAIIVTEFLRGAGRMVDI